MSGMITDAVKAVAGPVKTLVVDWIKEYVQLINTYPENMETLVKLLTLLCDKKLDLEATLRREKANLHVMTRETGNWLKSVMVLIEKQEMKQLMKEDGVAEIVVKMMEHAVLKRLWNDDREIFDIVVDVVKNKCNPQAVGVDRGVVNAEEEADYKKVAKIASDVIKDIVDEFTEFIKGNDAAIVLVKLLDEVDLNTVELDKLMKDEGEMAMILSKAEGIIRKEVGHNHEHDDDEEKEDNVQQPVNESFIKEKVQSLRTRMGRLTAFLDDENFKKSLPEGANLGWEVMNALSNSSGSEHATENDKPHRYCGYCIVRFQVKRRHHDMSERALTMIKTINLVIGKYPSDQVTRPITEDELENIPGEFIEGLESREVLLQRILIALKNDQVTIVGVYGMGGCGKTTLAKEIAHKRINDLFDGKVVVEVSETPDIKGIQNQIAGGIGLTFDDMHNVSQRSRVLYNRLKSEKILIVLDNLWEKLKLDEVGIPSKSTKDSRCKLLITTREERVCRLMDVEEANIFKVGLLNKREALKLFENQAEKKVSKGEFKVVADRLLRKCGGLPLAIATTANALRGKYLSMWYHFVETSEKPITSQVSGEYRETYSILETSYKLIDIEEKRIFLFLVCLSPLSSAVTIDELMRYGIGLDLFQHVNGLSEAMEEATTWANELISSSLLLKGDSDGEVRIHDLVRASFISFINKGKDRMTLVESIPRWMCKDTFEKVTTISLMYGHDFSRLSGVKAPMLEILLLKSDVALTTLASDFFGGMKNLKVLSLSNMNFDVGLPESMGELERLQTLHLHHCKLKDVKLIGKLVNLLVLSLRESSFEELALEIRELCNLRLLDIANCKGVKSIPANILSRLSNLEGLYMLNVFDDWVSTNTEVNDEGGHDQVSGSELDMLSHLNALEMEVFEAEQLLTVNNDQFVEQLGKFRISVKNSYKWDMAEVSAFRYVLELKDIHANQNKWLRALLKKADCLLILDSNKLTENLVPQLDEDGFKDLKFLDVNNCDVKHIISSSEPDESMAFAKLELLRLQSMHNLEMICDMKSPTRIFSNLQRLTLMKLPELKCGLPLTFELLNLREIYFEECDSLKFIVTKDESETKKETDIVHWPCLRSLYLESVDKLSNVLGERSELFTREHVSEDHVLEDHPFFNAEIKYPSLESFTLSWNNTVVTLWDKTCYDSNFQNLKFLEISNCWELEYLGSPSMFASLVQLEELTIEHCGKLKEVVAGETEEQRDGELVIVFPRLKRLTLQHLKSLEKFYGGSHKLEFPSLKSLIMSNSDLLASFDGSESSTTFFSDKLKFPCLEELQVKKMDLMEPKLWNWDSSAALGESESSNMTNIPLDPVPKLQKLTLGQITYIPHFISQRLSWLQIIGCHGINTLFSVSSKENVLWTYSQLSKVESLYVDNCESLEQLFENEDDNDAVMLCGRLTLVDLSDLAQLKMVPLHLFKNILTLTITKLKWKYIFSGDLFIKGREQLQQLENLSILYCKNIKVIIKDEVDRDGEDIVYGFPNLKKLILMDLKIITNFASKPNTGLHFQSLESLQLTNCERMKSFCSGAFTAPKLKQVDIRYCFVLPCLVSGKINDIQGLSSLETVKIKFCSQLLSFCSEPLVAPKLYDVNLRNCDKMKWFLKGGPNPDDILELPSLEKVYMYTCKGMKSFTSGEMRAPKLCQLKIDGEDYSKCANEELQDLLRTLIKRRQRYMHMLPYYYE